MSQAPYEVYAKQLALKKNGYPLWRPDPHDEPAVEIADVGYVEKGKFIRLFNASMAIGDEANSDGVPRNYTPLQVGKISKDTLSAGFPITSKNVTHIGGQLAVSGGGGGGGFSFECGKGQGAVLVLGDHADVRDALDKKSFLQYIRRNYQTWLDFAEKRLITLSDLVLVTGCDKTSAWACASIWERSMSIGLRIFAGPGGVLQGSVGIWASWDECQSVDAHSGPQTTVRPTQGLQSSHTTESIDGGTLSSPLRTQCIFVRGFKLLDRKTWRRKLRMKEYYDGFDYFEPKSGSDSSGRGSSSSGPASNGSGYSGLGGTLGSNPSGHSEGHSRRCDENSGRRRQEMGHDITLDVSGDAIFTSVEEDALQFEDIYLQLHGNKELSPLDVILDFILENSVAEIALVHDDDLTDLILHAEHLHRLDEWIREADPKIYVEDQVGMLYNTYQASISVDEEFGSEEKSCQIGIRSSVVSTPQIPQMFELGSSCSPSPILTSAGFSYDSHHDEKTGISPPLAPDDGFASPTLGTTIPTPAPLSEPLSALSTMSRDKLEEELVHYHGRMRELESSNDALRHGISNLEQADKARDIQYRLGQFDLELLISVERWPAPPDWEARTAARIKCLCAPNRAGNAFCRWHHSRRERRVFPPRMAPQNMLNCGCTYAEALFEESLARNHVGALHPGEAVRMDPALRNALLKLLQERYGYQDGDFERQPNGTWREGDDAQSWNQRITGRNILRTSGSDKCSDEERQNKSRIEDDVSGWQQQRPNTPPTTPQLKGKLRKTTESTPRSAHYTASREVHSTSGLKGV